MINQSLLCGGIFLDGIMITGGRPLSGSIRVQKCGSAGFGRDHFAQGENSDLELSEDHGCFLDCEDFRRAWVQRRFYWKPSGGGQHKSRGYSDHRKSGRPSALVHSVFRSTSWKK